MPDQRRQAAERGAKDFDPEMPAPVRCARVAGMQVALIPDVEKCRLEAALEPLAQGCFAVEA
jgi:hypothetical protein